MLRWTSIPPTARNPRTALGSFGCRRPRDLKPTARYYGGVSTAPKSSSSVGQQPPRRVPSKSRLPGPLWKAYAAALRPFLTSEGDLASRNMAFYVCSPFTYGIPGGSKVPVEIKNQNIANYCDRVLPLDSPLFSDGDDYGSYFNTQLELLSSADAAAAPSSPAAGNVAAARQKLVAYQDAALAAYNADVSRFAQAKSLDRSLGFSEWMAKYGIQYETSSAELQNQLGLYKELLRGHSAGPLAPAMDLMRSASSRRVYEAGNNMPCSAQDLGRTHLPSGANADPIKVDQSQVFYRPLYSLSGYDRSVDSWVNTFDLNAPPSIVLDLDFESAASMPWSVLGHPGLDNADDPPPQPVESKAESSTADDPAAAIRPGDPAASQPLPPSSKPPEVSISLYGLQAFDVDRGFWNIDMVRTLSRAGPSASAAPRPPRVKITRVLCGYKAQLRLSFDPQSAPTDAAAAHDRLAALGLGVPSAVTNAVTAQRVANGSLVYRTSNDAVMIPQVLAVLGRVF